MIIGKEKLESMIKVAFTSMEEEVDDATLGACMLICEVRMREPDTTAFFTFCTDRRTWVQRAMLEEGGQVLFDGV